MLLIAFWARFPDPDHGFNKLPELADKNKTWHPLPVLAELKDLFKSLTWPLQKDGLVPGSIQCQPLTEQIPVLGTGQAIGFTGKSHHWSSNAAVDAG